MNNSIYIDLYEQESFIKTLKDESPAVFWGFGIFLLFSSIANILLGVQTENAFQILSGVFFLLFIWEMYSYAQGKGTLLSRLFPRFISINQEGISVKQNGFKKPEYFSWDSIHSIEGKVHAFILNPGGTEAYEVSLKNVSYRELRKIKSLILRLAQDRGILIQT